MKKVLSATFIICLIISLSSCSNKSTITETSESNVDIADVAAIKPHTTQTNNDIFAIKLDDKFNDLYDTVVELNYIEIYDKESENNGYNGLVFAICAFQNPEDWAGGPHEKVGELSLKDGKVYDIIIGYPTESQFGFDTNEMPKNYKSLYDARYDIAKSLVASDGTAIMYGQGSNGEGLYDDIIKNLIEYLSKNNDGTNQSENISNIYDMIKSFDEDYLDKIVYAYYDVNTDGIDELLIGDTSNENKAFTIYDLYTMVDRKPVHVVSGSERNRYYAIDSGLIRNEYSNSANNSGIDIYNLETNSTNMVFQTAVKYDSEENSDNPWFVSYVKENDDYDWDPISEETYEEMVSRFSNDAVFDYKKLSDFNK